MTTEPLELASTSIARQVHALDMLRNPCSHSSPHMNDHVKIIVVIRPCVLILCLSDTVHKGQKAQHEDTGKLGIVGVADAWLEGNGGEVLKDVHDVWVRGQRRWRRKKMSTTQSSVEQEK
jgi:hypothetical protein